MPSMKMDKWCYGNIPNQFQLVLVTVLIAGSSCFSQNLQKIREVGIENPVAVSMDRNGSLLVADKNGSMNKYSIEGEKELNYSPQRNGRITLLEAWTTLDILAFYGGLQSVTILNRFLTPTFTIDLAPFIGYARLATYNYESNIWAIDDSDFNLKLLDLALNRVTISTPLNLILDEGSYDIRFIREYQNLLFIGDYNTGILIFDNLGNYLRTLDVKAVDYFGFVKNEIYYLIENNLIFRDIYTNEEHSLAIPKARHYLVSNDRLFIFSKDTMAIYQY